NGLLGSGRSNGRAAREALGLLLRLRGGRRDVVDWREGKKGLIDRLTHKIQSRLEPVNEFVNAAADNLFDIAVVEFRPQPPQPLFGERAEGTRLAARDRQERVFRTEEAEVHRAGEVAVENEELGDLRRC